VIWVANMLVVEDSWSYGLVETCNLGLVNRRFVVLAKSLVEGFDVIDINPGCVSSGARPMPLMGVAPQVSI
jgi:hypothetical protein